LLRQWNQTEEVVKHPIQTGRPRVMSSLEVSCLKSLIERTLDIYISKLQHSLFIAYNLEVDAKTITWALYQCGFTQKKVSISG
ncbi:hypothetical protein HYPSUDRAFT_149225, partial [Hypholoma sublateritium FD-334 SS-4]